MSETHSSPPNSSFPPPLGPPSRVSSSSIWILHKGIILFPNCFWCCYDESLRLKHDNFSWICLNVLKCSYVFFTFFWLFITCSCINTSFNLKSTSKIWKTCLFHNSFKSLSLGYHHTHTFTRIYFSIQMQCLINWIMVYHMHTH